MNKFKQLKQGDIAWNEIREYVQEKEQADECVFCGAAAMGYETVLREAGFRVNCRLSASTGC